LPMFRHTRVVRIRERNMKAIICVAATTALSLFGSLSHARGTPSSSFVPRGPEPHSSLSDKHHSIKNKHSGSQGAAHKSGHSATPKTGTHSAQHTPQSN
jgi:hypothetical protein